MYSGLDSFPHLARSRATSVDRGCIAPCQTEKSLLPDPPVHGLTEDSSCVLASNPSNSVAKIHHPECDFEVMST